MKISPNILDGCRQQERCSQESLYKIVYIDLIRVGLRYVSNKTDAEDILNKTMFKVFTKILKFKGDNKNFGGWIRRILVNEAIDFIRSKKAFNAKHIPVADFPESAIGVEEIMEEPSSILLLLDALPLKAKAVFNLYVIEGYKHQEISDVLGISVANSKWNLHLARKKLKKWIIEKELV